MLNLAINFDFGNKIYGMINMEAIQKFDIKSVIKSDIKFDISIKPVPWIRHHIVSLWEELPNSVSNHCRCGPRNPKGFKRL